MVSGEKIEQAIRSHVDAFNSRDIEALMAGFASDAVWITGTDLVRGEDALKTFFSEAFELAPMLSLDALVAAEGVAACEFREHFSVNGRSNKVPIAGFYRFRGNRITSAKIYREGSAHVV